ncbi:hypothetical protein COV20_00840 [Candidatus Woesearchaeota archaeon CG10_big_fil_rev_8_21_14_0_10_45_16]|nr:MAG: hypothetical protein COV20_00840 [Candidatus Woesearchaeota archaeon CG10_big_fil_rev_8_21_14_0_10_45_16]
MEETILLIAQVSASLTTILGAVALFYVIQAVRSLLPGELRKIMMLSAVAFGVALLGLSSMTVFHLLEESSHEIAEVMEFFWYLLMFLALLIFCYESWQIASFGKRITEPLEKFGKKKRS